LIAVFYSGALFAASTASAATMYEYTGNTYNDINNYNVHPDPNLYDNYDNTMSVTGHFILAEELIDTTGYGTVADVSQSVLSYSFSDGINTLTNENSDINSFVVAYAPSGEFVHWDINFSQSNFGSVSGEVPETVYRIITENDIYNVTWDIGVSSHCSSFDLDDGYGGGDICADVDLLSSGESQNNQGVWVSSSVVPVPAAAWLFGSALAGLGWMRRKHTV
jgi:hypothetical protein